MTEYRQRHGSSESAVHITILSTADFDNPVWTNKQFIATGLADSYSVTYIDSLGLRQPSFRRSDFKRILSKVVAAISHNKKSTPEAQEYHNIQILSPRVLPFHGNRIIHYLNQRLLTHQVLAKVPPSQRHILWSFSPVTYGLEDHFGRVVYQSVDLLHTLPGTPAETLLDAERSLVSKAQEVIVSSRGIRDHMIEMGRHDVVLWENVADTALYEASARSDPKNRVIFSGNLTPTKIDFDLLERIAATGIELALAGPIAIDGTSASERLDNLTSFNNVHYLGRLAPKDLAREVGDSRVGIIPYNVNSHTDGIFPMKVYEYLAAGLAVISTPLVSLVEAELPLGIHVVKSADFVSQVEGCLAEYSPQEAEKRRISARPFSWHNRLESARDLVKHLVSSLDTTKT